jgi:hypothetical protein
MLNDERRGIEEAYTAAGNSSDLTVSAEHKGDADLLIAAGLSESRVGMALLRLHSEWDKAEKPRKPTQHQIQMLTDAWPRYEYRKQGDEEVRVTLTDRDRSVKARAQAQAWYMAEMAKLINKLKSLPAVRSQLIAYVPKWGIAEASLKVPAVIAYWLDQTCHQCNGLKFQPIPGTPTLSNRVCQACGGVGATAVPYGQEGRRVANYMDDCVQKARQSIRKRLHPPQAVA